MPAMGPSASSINCLLPSAEDQYLLPPQGHSLGGLGWAPPSLDSAHWGRLQRCWHFHPPCWALKGAASEARSEARQAAPVCSDPHWPPPAPHQPLHPHTFPGQGHTDPQLRPLLWLPVSQNPPHASGACCPSLERSMCPRAAFTCPWGWALSPHQYFPTPVHAFAPPPTRCLGDCILLGTLVHRTLLHGHEPHVSEGGLEGPQGERPPSGSSQPGQHRGHSCPCPYCQQNCVPKKRC